MTVKTVETFEEEGELYQQTVEYNPVTEEADIRVPAHRDRIGVRVLVGKNMTATVLENNCIIEDTQKDVNISFFSVSKVDKDGVISQSRPKVYRIYTDLGEMETGEVEKLSSSIKKACETKSIHKVQINQVNQTIFEAMKEDQTVTTQVRQSRSSSSCSKISVS